MDQYKFRFPASQNDHVFRVPLHDVLDSKIHLSYFCPWPKNESNEKLLGVNFMLSYIISPLQLTVPALGSVSSSEERWYNVLTRENMSSIITQAKWKDELKNRKPRKIKPLQRSNI